MLFDSRDIERLDLSTNSNDKVIVRDGLGGDLAFDFGIIYFKSIRNTWNRGI